MYSLYINHDRAHETPVGSLRTTLCAYTGMPTPVVDFRSQKSALSRHHRQDDARGSADVQRVHGADVTQALLVVDVEVEQVAAAFP
ncbi:hypothetical protein DPMN_161021 [Dreissena polymorpha]|uniref:Uncharacterized protein n=1 Tax=Dreissena polymorpha TaxID=45954 RepID=A0A9D4IT33_DREPO|nr:hypothetical protein DPMN_161021 [Dreissena polymorpha]